MDNLTARKIAGMLTENTGSHFLDSGGAYGRNWQHNQGRAFKAEPECTLEAKYGINVTHNVYHWLQEKLEYNPNIQRQFTRFANSDEMSGESWFGCVAAYMDKLEDKAGREGLDFGGIYGEGRPVTVNTYNHQSLLSQTIQFTYWEDSNGEHVFLQIHGGCDVRGGYTKPVAFDVREEIGIFDDQRAGIYCTNENAVADQLCIDGMVDEGDCESSWYTDDGYHWYANNDEGDLDKYELVQADDELEDGSVPAPGKGYIFVDENGIPHCPHCGSKLAASPY